jgi:hypothetical protein
MLISWTGLKSKIQAKKRDKQQHRANILPKNPWFDKECKIEKNKAKKIFLQDVNKKHSRAEYLTRKKEYRNIVKSKKTKAELHNKLLLAKHNSPREFWKYICEARKESTKLNVDTDELYNHFKSSHENRQVASVFNFSIVTFIPELDDVITHAEWCWQ